MPTVNNNPNGQVGATVSDLILTPGQMYVLSQEAGWNRAQAVIAMALGLAESGGKIGAESPPNTNGTIDRGWLQINSVHGYDSQKLLTDARYTAKAGYEIYKKQGWRAWSTWKTPKFYEGLKKLDESGKREAEREYGNGKISDTITNSASDAYQTLDGAVDAVSDPLSSVGDLAGKLGMKSTWINIGLVTIGGVLTAAAILILAGEFMQKMPTPVSAVTKGLK